MIKKSPSFKILVLFVFVFGFNLFLNISEVKSSLSEGECNPECLSLGISNCETTQLKTCKDDILYSFRCQWEITGPLTGMCLCNTGTINQEENCAEKFNPVPPGDCDPSTRLTATYYCDNDQKMCFFKKQVCDTRCCPAGKCCLGNTKCCPDDKCCLNDTECGECPPPPCQCSDGTPCNQCKTGSPPVYCDGAGNLINKCSKCSCPSGQTCQDDKGCVPSTPPTPIVPTPGAAITIPNPLNATTFQELIDSIISFIFYIGLALAPLMIIIAAFYLLTAGGDPKRVETAKSIIMYTVIGLAIILLAKGLVAVIQQVLGGT